MDETLNAIVEFVADTDIDAIPESALEVTKRHLVDAIACGAGAFASPNTRKIREAVAGVTESPGASAYGFAAKTTPELAAFVNASHNRSLDHNDFGPAGHPSDMMPSQLAVAEAIGASGADVLRGIHVAYEVATALADAAPIFDLRWDMGLYYGAAAAAGCSAILGFDRATIANAVALALVPNVPLRVTRATPGSEWRSSATAAACMDAVFASRLARAGLSGPPEPFAGPDGLFEMVVQPAPIRLGEPGPSAIERGCLKKYSACFQAQSAIDAALRVRGALDGATIERVTVECTRETWWYIGGGRGDRDARWSPSTREAADHSIPYILANAFLDGRVDRSTYAPERLADRSWEPLIRRIEVLADTELSDGSRAALNPCRVTVETNDGQVMSEASTFPYDDAGRSVVTSDDVATKFAELTDGVLSPGDATLLLDVLGRLETVADLDELTARLRAFGRQ